MSKKEIIEYNSTECFVTQRLAKKISDLLENTFFTDLKGEQKNLKVKAFYGASAVSSKIMKAYNIDDLSIKESEMSRQLKNIFEQAYYGGRAECLKIGTFRNVYKYDINSAYPSVMQNLIRISHFTYNKKPNQDRLKDDGIYNISFNFSVPKNFIMPFPLRHKSGMIFFPKRVKGWYFGCEINSFLKNYIFQNEWVDFLLHIKEGFEPVYLQSIQEEISHNENYIFGNCIEELYEQRKVFKQSDDLRAYIIKITLNAMYGKLAQRTGKHQFLNMYYAGYITAKTRSIIYNTSMESYEDIIFFATDCLLSKKKLKNLDVGNELGQWEEKKVNKAVVLMSGIYEIIYSEDSLIYGMRGFRIDNKIFKNILQDIRKKGTTDIILSGFISHKLALTQHKAYGNKRLQFTEIKKNINPFNQIKREFNFKIKNIDNAYNSNYIDMEQTESSLIKNCIYTENLEDRYE
jgi:DNA polymerase elongation subunit (family B)